MVAQVTVDGFLPFERLLKGHVLHNAGVHVNHASPHGSLLRPIVLEGGPVLIDRYYGLSYEAGIGFPAPLYGSSDLLPSYAGDSLANFGYLRTPFRRIPRVLIQNRRDLIRLVSGIQSADPDSRLLFRGQVREYYISRSELSRQTLFGDKDAMEPSLLPSSTRSGIELEQLAPEWSTLVQLFIVRWFEELVSQGRSDATLDTVRQQLTRLVSGYGLWGFLVALAQHYGLPSAGLDVTNRLDVALYFALTEFDPAPDMKQTMNARTRDRDGAPSVLYLISRYPKHIINFDHVRPFGFPTSRPDAQSAKFLHTSWHLASNATARYIFLAIYLDPSSNWGPLPSTAELFPAAGLDPFGQWLANADTFNLSSGMQALLSRFYWAR